MPIHPFRDEDKETGNSTTRDGASKMCFVFQKMKEPQTRMQLNTAQLPHIRGVLGLSQELLRVLHFHSVSGKKQNKPKTKTLKYPFILPKPYPVADRRMVPVPRLSLLF